MPEGRKGLSVIFHSGSYDRVYNGLTVALTAAAQGRPTRLFFTYWSIDILMKSAGLPLALDKEATDHKDVVEENIEAGRMKKMPELLGDAKALGTKIYVCTGSLEMRGIASGDLVEEVDEVTGTASFLKEAEEDQLIFV